MMTPPTSTAAPTPEPEPHRQLRYRAGDIEVPADDPHRHDGLARKPFVDKLVDVLEAARESLVFALNGAWGQGKTTTLRLLEPALTKRGITWVSFNAWKVDHVADPLLPLLAEVHAKLSEVQGVGGLTPDKVKEFKRRSVAVAKGMLVGGAKALTGGILNLDDVFDETGKALEDAAKDAVGQAVGDLIDALNKDKAANEAFRNVLEEMVGYLRKLADHSEDVPPFVVIIDELDRCRPSFAIEMLERIKHFFEVPGLVFLLALDMKQLEAITRKVYGHETDAAEYLRRFVDIELQLPPAKAGPAIDGC